jgi:hypothetical protein
MKLFTESIISEMKPVSTGNSNALCFLEGPCMQFGHEPNRNNRIYSKKLVEDRIINNPTVQEALKNRSMLGEGGHPENRVDISYPDVALAVEKLWIPEGNDNKLWGRFAILDTPVGRILETLVKYGTKLGISARAVADSYQKDGHEVIVENSYELITFDAVPEPGFKCARLEQVDPISKSVDKMSTKELKESAAALRSFKNPVFESRIRSLDKEICKRENKADINAITDSINRLSNVLDKSLEKVKNIKYEKKLASLISEARAIVNEAKKESSKQLKQMNENNASKNSSISNKYVVENSNINKFRDDSKFNEDLNVTELTNKDTLLEKMCSNFRRNLYE